MERLEEKKIFVLDEDEHIIPESNIREPYEIEMVALSDVKKIVQEVAKEYKGGYHRSCGYHWVSVKKQNK